MISQSIYPIEIKVVDGNSAKFSLKDRVLSWMVNSFVVSEKSGKYLGILPHLCVVTLLTILEELITYRFLCRELETAFDEERDACKAEKAKVAILEETLGTERKKLQEEIDEKLHIITDLSKQLEVHQKNFDALKSELSQVKQRPEIVSRRLQQPLRSKFK